MSYNVYLSIDTGREELTEVVEIGNMTSNVAPMWRKALPPDGIAGLHLRRAGAVAEQLRDAVHRMEDNPDEYRAMNPPNGWGDYEGALEYLDKIAKAASKHPACVIEVFR